MNLPNISPVAYVINNVITDAVKPVTNSLQQISRGA